MELEAVSCNRLPFNKGESFWANILEKLKVEYGTVAFNSWFIHLSFIEIKDSILKLTAPTKFIRESIINNYFTKIKNFVTNENSDIKIIDLRVKSNRISSDNENHTNENFFNTKEYNDNLSSTLDPQFTFENFIVGESNKFAFDAAKSIAYSSVEAKHTFKVLFLHGIVGMGKTHLLQSIANFACKNNSKWNIAYLSAEKFMHQYIMSIRNNTSLSFKEHLRKLDLLIIDDIQFICGKSGTQQEFANTFNALIESGKRVIISSDRSAYQLELDNRTKSRIGGGLAAEIKSADYDLRFEIIKYKAQYLNLDISENILEFVAQSVTSSIREVEGALNNLALHSISNYKINISQAKDVLRDCILAHQVKLTVPQIMETVATFYGVTIADLTSKSRKAKIVTPRQVAIFVLKQLTDKSLKDIGNAIGKRDHATVIYSLKKLEEMMSENSNINDEVSKIIDILASK